jgi:hypothetical protein
MQWVGSLDNDDKSGQATFSINNKTVTVNLPDLSTAIKLHSLIETVYFAGEKSGVNRSLRAVQSVDERI